MCTQCPAGRETRRETGASTCTACIPGTSLLTNATTQQLSINCTACPSGSYAERPGTSGTCPACPAGYAVSDTGNQVCGSGWVLGKVQWVGLLPEQPGVAYGSSVYSLLPPPLTRLLNSPMCPAAVRHLPAGHLPGQARTAELYRVPRGYLQRDVGGAEGH